jgi:hypothetical protein
MHDWISIKKNQWRERMPTKMQHCIRFLWANDIDMQAKSNQFKYIHHALQSANTEIKNNLLITEFKNNLSVRRCVFVAYQSEKYVNFQHGIACSDRHTHTHACIACMQLEICRFLLHSLEVAACHQRDRADVKMWSLLETATNGEKLCQFQADNSLI